MRALRDLEKRRPKDLPSWRRSNCFQVARDQYQGALRATKRWIGPGTDEALLSSYTQTKKAIDYITYLYLSLRYRKLLQEYGVEDQLLKMQMELFNALGEMGMVIQRRDIPLKLWER